MKTRTFAISLLVFSMCFTSCSNNGGKLEEIEKQVNKIALNTANSEPIYNFTPHVTCGTSLNLIQEMVKSQ